MPDYFSYPLDTGYLIRKKKKIKRELFSLAQEVIEIRVAVLGGSTTDELVDQLEIFLLSYGIQPSFYQSDYNKYYEDAVFGNDVLNDFCPDIIYIHTNWHNIISFPEATDDQDVVNAKIDAEFARYSQMWRSLSEKFNCTIIQNNFDRPDYRLMGNRDIWDAKGRTHMVMELNQKLYDYARGHDGFYVNDIDYLAAEFGLGKWNDQVYWHMYKYAMSLDAIPYVADSVAKIIKSIYGKNKKILVLDLDHTLWGGEVGDDGVDGIEIGCGTARGEAFLSFQEYCKKLEGLGVLLAVASKNDYNNAIAGLGHRDGILKKEDFVSIRANWESKDQNIREIAEELSLGTDAFVFVDDNPMERDMVHQMIPEVSVCDADKPEEFVRKMDQRGDFEVTICSEEDGKKTQIYLQRTKARMQQAAFLSYGEYLNSLGMTAAISDFKPGMVRRIAQLTNKSNQFNLTTKRCTEGDIQTMQDSGNWMCLCGRLTDKFGDHGIVAVTAGEQVDDELHIRLWLMSCRVLKRGLEDAVMNVVMEYARKKGLTSVVGYYVPTKKNLMVRDFYKEMGFRIVDTSDDGGTVWRQEVASFKPRKLHMGIEKFLIL